MIEKGLYRHYKGNIYEVIENGKHSETLEEVVIYRDTTDETKVWVRPSSMWNEVVNVNGKDVLRFQKI